MKNPGPACPGPLTPKPEGIVTVSRDYNCSDMKCLIVSATIGDSYEAITEFSAIYAEIMAVCKVARRVFRGNPEIKFAFSFAKALKALGN